MISAIWPFACLSPKDFNQNMDIYLFFYLFINIFQSQEIKILFGFPIFWPYQMKIIPETRRTI